MVIIPFLVVLGILFVGLVFVLRYMLGKSRTDAVTHLQSLSDENSRKQEELKRQLMEAEKNYQERMARARTEAEKLISDARQFNSSSSLSYVIEASLVSDGAPSSGEDPSIGCSTDNSEALVLMRRCHVKVAAMKIERKMLTISQSAKSDSVALVLKLLNVMNSRAEAKPTSNCSAISGPRSEYLNTRNSAADTTVVSSNALSRDELSYGC